MKAEGRKAQQKQRSPVSGKKFQEETALCILSKNLKRLFASFWSFHSCRIKSGWIKVAFPEKLEETIGSLGLPDKRCSA
jgi:hypothetical protein